MLAALLTLCPNPLPPRRYWTLAKRLLKDSGDTAAVADILEAAARQEMGLPSRSSAASSKDSSAVPAGLHGSFMAASKLLREAL